MNILFLTRSPIRRENSTGNTLLHFFDRTGGILPADWHYHALSLRRGAAEADFADTSLSFGDGDLVRRLLRRTPLPRPCRGANVAASADLSPAEQRLYRHKENTTVRYLAYPLRDLLWAMGGWKEIVRDYVRAVSPDVIVFPTGGQGYHTRVLRYIHTLTDAPIILYHGDDHYTLSLCTPNPLYYPRRILERRRTRTAVRLCAAQLGASEWQCRAYEAAMGKPCSFITKGKDFSEPILPLRDDPRPLSLVYTGNILLGRLDSLLYLARLLDRLTAEGTPATLTVYSGNALSRSMHKKLGGTLSLRFRGAVSADAIPAIQAEADVLVHAESFSRTNRAIVRQSFSTKLVDYLHAARPILAVGPDDVASVSYLKVHDLALRLTGDKVRDLALLRRLLDPATRKERAARAHAFGQAHHSRAIMQGMIRDVMERATSGCTEK